MLDRFLLRNHYLIWLEGSLQIERAGGLQCGETNTADAHRIAEYACRLRNRMRLRPPSRSTVGILERPPLRCDLATYYSGVLARATQVRYEHPEPTGRKPARWETTREHFAFGRAACAERYLPPV